jgi:hypothetical protein
MELKWTVQTVDLETLYSGIVKGKWWMDPPHQRNVVHNDKWQSKIIESYMKEYIVPPAIFDIFTDEDGFQKRRSIDGKQRTMAVFRYLNDEYSYKNEFPTNMKNKTFSELTQREKQKLFYKNATIYVANRQLTDNEIEEMFSRMQETKKTTLGELLNSRQNTSPIIGYILKLMNTFNPFFENKDNRHARLEIMVRIFYCINTKHNNENGNCDVSPSKLTDWVKNFKIEKLPKYTLKLVKFTLNALKLCKTKNKYSKTFVLPLVIVLNKQVINKQTFKIKKSVYKKFCEFVQETDIDYPHVGGNHSATKTRVPFLDELFNAYTKR